MGKPTRVTNSIRSLRFANGEMTQAELAERIGVTRQTIIAIEQGRYFAIARDGVPDRPRVPSAVDEVFQLPGERVITPMKAITYSRYGGPDVLEHTEIDKPVVEPTRS